MSTYSISLAVGGSSGLPTVPGVWEKKSDLTATSEGAIDVIARLETPPPDFAHSTVPNVTYSTYSDGSESRPPLEFFAGGASEYRPMSLATAPPPYAPRGYDYGDETRLQSDGEPLTLASLLFMYGFFFFPFWLAGAYILCSPLLPTPDWEAGKTEDEKAYLLRLLRETELKWARRCLYGLYGLLFTAFILFVIIKYGILGTI